MLNRFRDIVKRLELPQEEDAQQEVVYRIIDSDNHTVEVTPAQYAIWRTRNDATSRAVVGHDTVEDVMVRTTFSIMPENRAYKPYGTSAYSLPLYDPLLEYFHRYDTWEQARNGHRNVLDHIRRKAAQARADAETSRAFAGTAAEVEETLSAQLPALFSVRRAGDVAVVRTPLLRPDGSAIEISLATVDAGYELTEYASAQSWPESMQGGALLDALGVTTVDGLLTCTVDDAGQLARGLMGLAQAIAIAASTPTE